MKGLTLSLFLGASIASSLYGAYGQATGTPSGGYGANPTGSYTNTGSNPSGTYSNTGTYGTSNTKTTTPNYQQGSTYSNTGSYGTPSNVNTTTTPGYQQGSGYNTQGSYQSTPSSQPSYMPPQANNDRRNNAYYNSYSVNDQSSHSSSSSANSGAATTNPKASSDIKYATEKKYPKDQFKTESDRAINNRIRDLIIGWASDNFNEIVLRTSEGVVVVDGFVFTPEDQKKLIDELEQVNGVKHVVNNTKIKKK